MEDEQQSTLKKKIQILFQLGKWPDVIKLCGSYAEKFGKDMEIDMIRFKCERHLGIQPPAAKPAAEENRGVAEDKNLAAERPRTSIGTPDPTIPLIPPTASDELAPPREDKIAYETSPDPDDVDIGNPFTENELVISDPFADEEPGLRLAPDEPPVVISESGLPDAEDKSSAPGLDMPSPDPSWAEPLVVEEKPDFVNVGSLTIDTEPDLLLRKVPERTPAPVAGEEAREAFDDAFRSTSGRIDVVEERVEDKRMPLVRDMDEQEHRPRGSLFTPTPQIEPSERKKPFNLKLVLMVVLPLLLAAALWLALSGKLDLSGDEPPPAPEPAAERPLPKRPRPVQPATPSDAATQAAEQDRVFAEKLKLAEDLSGRGDLANAMAALQEAKKIKETEPLNRLEEELARKIRETEAAAQKVPDAPKTEWDRESEALTKARETDTIAGWQAFMRAFPQSQSKLLAERRIRALDKIAQDEMQKQQLQRIQQARKVRLRSTPINLSQADLTAQVQPANRPPAQFEAHLHGGATVTLDLSTGLMWSLYSKPMTYDKAKWWANRVTAGYSGWRLPTIEEALTLQKMDRGQYSGLADFSIWTCDGVSDQPRTAWVLKLPGGQFVVIPYNQMGYVWAVRQAVK